MEVKTILENKVAESFGRSAQKYHQEAVIQKKVAEGLMASLRPWKDILPPGPFLEVGCGTGFLSELLVNEFPGREMLITDASFKMVEFVREGISGSSDTLSFDTLDVDRLLNPEPKYSLIVSNFATQWFMHPEIALENLGKMLLPGGLLLVTFPGNHSFEEWYSTCLELGLPYTANPLPDVEEVVIKLSLGPLQIDYYENDLFQEFDSSLDFFRHIKAIGAGKSFSSKLLNRKQLRLLTNYWDQKVSGNVKVKWHIVYLAAKKDMV